jgi:hypothetical protein
MSGAPLGGFFLPEVGSSVFFSLCSLIDGSREYSLTNSVQPMIWSSIAAPMGKGFNSVFPSARRMGQWQGRMTGPQEKGWAEAWSKRMGLDRLGRMPIEGCAPISSGFKAL